MDSLSDSIFKPRIGIKWKLDSPLGGKFRLTSWLRYHYHFENDGRDYPEFSIVLKNSLGKKGNLTLDANIISSKVCRTPRAGICIQLLPGNNRYA